MLHRGEIERLVRKAGTEAGPDAGPAVKLYFKDGKVKVELALARGKRTYDKRTRPATRDAAMEVERALAADDGDSGRRMVTCALVSGEATLTDPGTTGLPFAVPGLSCPRDVGFAAERLAVVLARGSGSGSGSSPSRGTSARHPVGRPRPRPPIRPAVRSPRRPRRQRPPGACRRPALRAAPCRKAHDRSRPAPADAPRPAGAGAGPGNGRPGGPTASRRGRGRPCFLRGSAA